MANVVSYTDEYDSIIEEEAKKNADNLAESFRASAERIANEFGEKHITPEKISTRYYTIINKRKKSNGNGAKKKATTSRATAPKNKVTPASPVKEVSNNTNITNGEVDEKVEMIKELTAGWNRSQKKMLIKHYWEAI